MAKYFKTESHEGHTYFCINEERAMSVLMTENEHNEGSIIVGPTDIVEFFIEDAKEIKETEFLNAVGDVQAAIQYFIDKTRIG